MHAKPQKVKKDLREVSNKQQLVAPFRVKGTEFGL
jgi:hypothetical protein